MQCVCVIPWGREMSHGGCYQTFFLLCDILLDQWNLQAPPTCTCSHTVNKKLSALVVGPAFMGHLHPAGNTVLYIKKYREN